MIKLFLRVWINQSDKISSQQSIDGDDGEGERSNCDCEYIQICYNNS